MAQPNDDGCGCLIIVFLAFLFFACGGFIGCGNFYVGLLPK